LSQNNHRGLFFKKAFKRNLIVLLSIGLVACSASTAKTTPSLTATSESGFITFEDPVLEAMVREIIGQPEGGITFERAKLVKRLDLHDDLQIYLSQDSLIEKIQGLEAFTNLESLDLSAHAITDISPLQGLKNLTSLSLAGNPIEDISPLEGLTNLKALTLSGSKAQDYSVLSKLINLQVLTLDHSTISDLGPLTGLTNLRILKLANSLAMDFSPLESLYPNLEGKDFIIATTLEELGFNLDFNSHQAIYDSEDASFIIQHDEWGTPPVEWEANIILIKMYLESGYKVAFGYYGDQDAYVFLFGREGEGLSINYVYNAESDEVNIDEAERASIAKALRAAIEVMEGEDPLLAPVRVFNDTIQKTFGMTATKLYSLPYEPPNLKSLGFKPDLNNAVYLYEYRGENILADVNMEVHRPEWGEKEYDIRFFTPLSDNYRIVITWHLAERKYIVNVDDNDQGGASFEYFIDNGEHQDIWCSYKDKTVEEYFRIAFNDPKLQNVYWHSVQLMEQYVKNTFGMTVEELYALPTGEDVPSNQP